MRRLTMWTMLVVAGGAGALMSAPAQQGNLVANPGLEADADGDGIPDNWSVAKPQDYPPDWHVGGGAGQCGISDLARSGAHSIVYSVPPPAFPAIAPEQWWDHAAWDDQARQATGNWAIAFKTNDFAVKEYHLYRARCWVRAENILRLHIKFIATFVYPGRDEPSIRWVHPLLHDPEHETHKSGSWEWEPWETLIAVPEFVEKGRIEFWVWEWPAPAKLYCDDMAVAEVRPYPFFERRRDR